MAGTAELDQPAVVDHAVHDRRGELVVGEHRAPAAELHVGGEHYAPPLVAVRYDLVEQPGAVHVEGHVAELVEHEQPRPGDVGQQPVEGALALGLAELQHELRRLAEPHRVARARRHDAERGRHVGLAAPRLAVEDEVLGGADERERQHVLAAPPVGERDVGPVEPVGRLGHREARLPEQPRPPRDVAVRDLGLEHAAARRHLPRRRRREEAVDGVVRYEQRPRRVAERRGRGLPLLPRAHAAPPSTRPNAPS